MLVACFLGGISIALAIVLVAPAASAADEGAIIFPALTLPTFTLPAFSTTSTTTTVATPTTLAPTTSTMTSTTTSTSTSTSTTTIPPRLCGDAVDDGRLTASDALLSLRASIGLDTCQPCVCDVNASGSITATDALSLLRGAVGGEVTSDCILCPDEPALRSNVRAVAEAIYDWVEAGEHISVSDISGLLALFDIVTVPSNDGAGFQEAVAADIPFVLDFQLEAISSALTDQQLVTVDSFVADLAGLGGEAADPAGPLTLPYLTEKLAPLAAQQGYSEIEILPALVIALGRERALRKQTLQADPVWGDGLLDPLQFTLLTYSAFYERPQQASLALAREPMLTTAATMHPRLALPSLPASWRFIIKQKGLGFGEYWLGTRIHFPLGPTLTAQVVVCASIVLNSYQMRVVNDPAIIARKSSNPSKPYEAEATATLTFNFSRDVDSFPQQLALWMASCELPENGQAVGKPVSWSLAGELPSHGAFVQQAPSTDSLGQAKAKYQAKDEMVPKELRTFGNQKTATGNVEARASNLMPEWINLERIVTFLDPTTGGQGYGVLQVEYYAPPNIAVTLNSRVKTTLGNGFVYESTVQSNTQLRAPKPSPDGTWSPDAKYSGSGTTQYQAFQIVADPDGCQTVAATYGATTKIAVPLGSADDSLSVLIHPGTPRETIRVDCPGDNIGPQDLPATLWSSGWQATHEADYSGGSADFVGEHWQTGGFSSAGDGQTITKTTSRQAQVNEVLAEAEDNWTIELQLQQ